MPPPTLPPAQTLARRVMRFHRIVTQGERAGAVAPAPFPDTIVPGGSALRRGRKRLDLIGAELRDHDVARLVVRELRGVDGDDLALRAEERDVEGLRLAV